MSLDWRTTLETLLPQFQAYAAKTTGLNHLLVEVADHERDRMMGPNWFQPVSNHVRVIDGKPYYEKWDCSSFDFGLPGVSPGFREARTSETFDGGQSERVIRDGSGVARAVPVPMKLRCGYFCGQPSEQVAPFKSLADAAAAALAGASDPHESVYASDLTDIFRKPRGGVRYVFGDVPGAPNQFMAQGWDAGVLQFENGVLIDVPISESSPNANHWLLLLHRLGWRHVEGSGLRAERKAWNDNVEVDWEMLNADWSHYPDAFSKQFAGISPDSFYSVVGTKDAPLDISLASVFAIQLLLADLLPQIASPKVEAESSTDYSGEDWKLQALPALRSVALDESKDIAQPRVGVLVVTEVERQAVLKQMRPPRNKRAVLQVHDGSNTYFIGRLGITEIVLCMTAMGSAGRDSSLIVTTETIEAWKLAAVVMVGIAFGKDASKQGIGNVLVSDRIISYEPQRVGATASEDRGSETMAGSVLLNRFRNVIRWSFKAPNGRECGFQCGPVLSGEKLVDNPDFKQSLFERYPNAVGGEMEGAGVAAAAERKRCEWIVVKSICDWGDGTKTKHHQEFAAAASVDLVEHVLNQMGALDSLS